jgi:hypothetical protein
MSLLLSVATIFCFVVSFAMIFWPHLYVGLLYLLLMVAMFEVFRRSLLYVWRFCLRGPVMNKPFILAHPADHYGCGLYRVIWPLQELVSAGVVDGMISDCFLSDRDLLDLSPDVVIFQRVLEPAQIATIRRYRRLLPRARLVFEIDDLITDIPKDNRYSSLFYRQTADRLKEGIGLCDVLTVTTPALAAAFGSWCSSVVVVPNSLPSDPWLSLRSVPRGGARPRVGWAGSAGHLGDLKILYPVVKATYRVFDWVFMGWIPNVLQRYAAEVHSAVPIADYPYQLASLGLDLAVAPLEVHRYNDAKSNLRLLEFGAVGWPIVCSAGVQAFDVDLPSVRRVSNDPESWIEALLHFDFDSSVEEGARLRQSIHRDWLLSGRLASWLSAWHPL